MKPNINAINELIKNKFNGDNVNCNVRARSRVEVVKLTRITFFPICGDRNFYFPSFLGGFLFWIYLTVCLILFTIKNKHSTS